MRVVDVIVPQDVAATILACCFGRPVAYDLLREMCDTLGGRAAGSRSAAQAESLSRDRLVEWAMDRVALDPFTVETWERGTLHVDVTAPISWRMTAIAHGFAPATAELTAEVIDVHHGEPADFGRAAEEVPGRLALCDEGASPGERVRHRSEKLQSAVEHGAAGLLILSSAAGGLARTGTCSRGEAPIPSLGIGREDGLRLRRLLDRDRRPQVRIRMTNSLGEGTAHNVIADLIGRDHPEEIVVAGAHLDSWDVAQGATDNGLGCAIVWEAARALASLPERPRRTVRFVLWGAEEIGLRGSKHYVNERLDQLDHHVAVMNFDMTGDPYAYWHPGRDAPGPLLASLTRQLAPLGMREEHDGSAALHSDHQPFLLAGVPVVGLRGRLPNDAGRYYHSVGDTFEKIDLAGLCRAAAVAAHTLWAIADAPERPWPRRTPAEVRAMIDDADLHGALLADGYDGPPMHVEPAVST